PGATLTKPRRRSLTMSETNWRAGTSGSAAAALVAGADILKRDEDRTRLCNARFSQVKEATSLIS
ncbi:MAG TPA: hypothetical protein VLK29_02675, partial [Luteimonas sp.]|nr:hypothetical protein [Luteimonas sp.]